MRQTKQQTQAKQAILSKKLFPKQFLSCRQAKKRLNIWEGAVSSGKTYCSIWKWLLWMLNEAPGKGAFLMTGKTERTLQRNILDPIVDMIGSKRFRVRKGSGEAEFYGRKIYLAGANDERAQEKIRGVSLAGAYGDEITLWPESYFKMLLSRLRIKGARLFGTTNPDSPYHWFKVEYLDRENEINLRRFQFSIDDNVTLDPEYVDSIKKEYTGLWYKRFILGLWVQAEGAIYDMWDESKHVMPKNKMPEHYDKIFAACDYGTTNPFAAGVYIKAGNKLYKTSEYHYDSHKQQRQKTDGEYADDMVKFIPGRDIPFIIDPSAASFKAEMRKRGQRVIDADNDVLNGIRLQANLLTNGRFFISTECVETQKEFPNYLWDKRAQQKGEDIPLKENDHHCVTGDTVVWTDHGLIPIVDLVGTAGLVCALNETTGDIKWAPYHSVALIQENAPILEVELENGSVLRCTPDHEFLTQRGRIRADELTENDEVEVIPDGLHNY